MLISMHLPSWQEYLEYHESLLLRLVRNTYIREHIVGTLIDDPTGHEVGMFFSWTISCHL
jgi:hypothetical protein